MKYKKYNWIDNQTSKKLKIMSSLKLYPTPKQVFAQPIALYTRHILPLASLDLSTINTSWSGWIHIVNTVEPEDEIVGKATQPFHNYYLRENWIGFQINEENRYELLGDFRYFYLENPSGTLPEHHPNHRKELEAHYEQQHHSFAATRNRFMAEQEKPFTPLIQVGGGLKAGNWADGFPLDQSDENNIRPLTHDSKAFHFIASARGWHYCASGADAILLFYEPNSRIALFTFDWS